MVYSCFVWNILPFSDLNDPSNLSLGYPTHWSVKLTLGGYIPLQTVYFSSNHERSVNSKVHHLSLHLPGAGSVKHTKCPHPIKCCLKATPNTLSPSLHMHWQRHPPTKPIRQLKVKLSVFRVQRNIIISEQRNQVWLCPIHLEIGVGDVGRSRLPVLLISHLWSLTAPEGDIWKDNDKIVIFSNEVNSTYIAKFL